MPSINKINVSNLQSGMVVLRFDKEGMPYPYYAQPLPSNIVESMREVLASNGARYAFIRSGNTPETLEEAEKLSEETLKNKMAFLKKAAPSPELADIGEAKVIHVQAKTITKSILSAVREGKALDIDASKEVVSELVTSCIKNPEAFVNMTRLKDFDGYTFTHSVNVAVLALSIGKRLGMGSEELQTLGLAGLLHDVGKMRIPESILNKPGKLTEEEFKIMRLHPIYGYEIMKDDSALPSEVAKAARQHHEKSDGTGYPDGLKETEITKYAKIIAISDVYDAITSDRVYHRSVMAPEALKMLFTWSGKHFNEILVKFFINLIGVYPAGTLVLLDSGEIAVVLETNRDDGTRPKILIVSDRNKRPLPEPRLFDLTSYNAVTGRPYRSILSPLKSETASINGNEIIERFMTSEDGRAVAPQEKPER